MDAFVTEYGFRTGKTFTYQPGFGEVTMKTGMGMDLDQLRELVKSVEHHELQINIDGTIFVYSPEEHGEEPTKPEETEPEIEEPVGKCPECGGPATHPSGLCQDCRQAKLEAEELDTLASEMGEETPEAIEIEEHRAPTPEEIEAMKLEDKDIPEELIEVMESARARVAKVALKIIENEEEKESSEEDAVVIIE